MRSEYTSEGGRRTKSVPGKLLGSLSLIHVHLSVVELPFLIVSWMTPILNGMSMPPTLRMRLPW